MQCNTKMSGYSFVSVLINSLVYRGSLSAYLGPSFLYNTIISAKNGRWRVANKAAATNVLFLNPSYIASTVTLEKMSCHGHLAVTVM